MKTLDTYKIVKKTFIQHFAKSSASSFMTLLFILAKVTSFLSTIACKRCVYFKFARWPRHSAYTKHTLDKTQPGNECTLDILNVALYFHLTDKSSSSFSHCLSIYIDVINVDVRGVLVF